MNTETFLKELKKLRIVVGQLTPQQQEVLKHRWGLYFCEILTLEETGKKLNVSRERIRQIEESLVKKTQEVIDLMKS